jgi:hypothetical protein
MRGARRWGKKPCGNASIGNVQQCGEGRWHDLPCMRCNPVGKNMCVSQMLMRFDCKTKLLCGVVPFDPRQSISLLMTSVAELCKVRITRGSAHACVTFSPTLLQEALITPKAQFEVSFDERVTAANHHLFQYQWQPHPNPKLSHHIQVLSLTTREISRISMSSKLHFPKSLTSEALSSPTKSTSSSTSSVSSMGVSSTTIGSSVSDMVLVN